MNTGRARRCRQLALLTVVVLAVHAALLAPGPQRLAPEPAPPTVRFMTRTLVLPPVVAASAATAPAVVRTVPPPQPRVAARTTSPHRTSSAPAKPLAASLTAWPSALLQYEVTARVRGIPLAGTATLAWQQDGQRYEARLTLALPGQRERVQQSTGAITPGGLVPERFSDRARSEQATHFDAEAGRVVFSNNQPVAEWTAGMQDRLSVVLQLAMLAAAQPALFAPGAEVAIPTATTRDADAWIFHVRGEEDLALAGEITRALKLERLPRKEFDQRIELWLAPGRAYAPVRLRLTNPDGGWVDQRWSSTDRR